jgi:thiol-disulfide isomerase/thioredoxin
MKWLSFLILLFSFTVIQAQQPVAKIKITDLEKTIAQSKTPLVINFWATFCIPCIEELPYFLEAANTYKKDSLTLLLVSLDLEDEYPAGIQKFMTKHKVQTPVAWLNETNADYFLPKIDKKWEGGIPATLFINNATGYRSFHGDQLSKEELTATIEKMLKKQ